MDTRPTRTAPAATDTTPACVSPRPSPPLATTSTTTADMSATGELSYRSALLQMQREFVRAVDALEKQVAGLTTHNALLETAQQRAHDTITSLTNELAMQREDALSASVAAQTRTQTLEHESAALAELLAHEQRYWQRFETAKQREVDALHAQLAAVRITAQQQSSECDTLRKELSAAQRRVATAKQTTKQLEQQLTAQRDAHEALDARLARRTQQLRDARSENAALVEALTRTTEQLQTTSDRREQRHALEMTPASSTAALHTRERRVRKREPSPAATTATATTSKQRRHVPHSALNRLFLSDERTSQAPTSPTASSPDLTPPSTPVCGDDRKYNTYGNKTNTIGTFRTTATAEPKQRTSSRMEHEMATLRRKLDACLQLSTVEEAEH